MEIPYFEIGLIQEIVKVFYDDNGEPKNAWVRFKKKDGLKVVR